MPWNEFLHYLEQDKPFTDDDINLWFRPVQYSFDNNILTLFTPNPYVADWLKKNCLDILQNFLKTQSSCQIKDIKMIVGTKSDQDAAFSSQTDSMLELVEAKRKDPMRRENRVDSPFFTHDTNKTINNELTFDNYIEGSCNTMARAASLQIINDIESNERSHYNPFLIYGGVGLGKTHLLHAIGNKIIQSKNNARVYYLTSTRFVEHMVSAFQKKTHDEFKQFYSSLDALLVDDIQFFAGRERSQIEFFHTFNTLLETNKQIIMTCDTYPKEVEGIEDRLKSRFSWGLSVGITMPDVETRVAILLSKANQLDFALPQDVAFFIASHIHSSIRDLEGALKTVISAARIKGEISIDFAQTMLRDLLNLQIRNITLENIQKKICEYFSIRVADIQSKNRSRKFSRPRQMAMLLSKELTTHSYIEIGDFYGGRDHSTAMHACRNMKKLIDSDARIKEDYNKLYQSLRY